MDTRSFHEDFDRRDESARKMAGNVEIADHCLEQELLGCEFSDQDLETAASGHRLVPTAFFVTYCFGCGV